MMVRGLWTRRILNLLKFEQIVLRLLKNVRQKKRAEPRPSAFLKNVVFGFEAYLMIIWSTDLPAGIIGRTCSV